MLCVYVWSEEEEGDDAASWRPGGASRAWLRHALDALDRDLRRRYGGGVTGLTYMRGAHADALRAAMRAADASAVFASERFEPAHVANDARVAAALARENLSVTLLPGHLLFDPRDGDRHGRREVLLRDAHAVRACGGENGGKPGVPRPAPPAAPLAGAATPRPPRASRRACAPRAKKNATSGVSVAPDVDALGVLPASDAALDWSRGIRAAWDISEAGAEEAWSHFKRANLARYEDGASFTEEDASAVSRLSPYLRFGQISPRRVYHELSVAEKPTGSGSGSRNRRGSNASDKGPSTKTGRQLSRTFWHRLYRREFAYWQLAHWPRLTTRSVRAHYEDRADWRLAWTEADDKRVAARGDYWVYDRERPKKDQKTEIARESSPGPSFGEEDVPASIAFARWRAGQTGSPRRGRRDAPAVAHRAGCTRRSA